LTAFIALENFWFASRSPIRNGLSIPRRYYLPASPAMSTG
jgi:hypothetical protein